MKLRYAFRHADGVLADFRPSIPLTVIKEVTRASRTKITQLSLKETPLSRTKFKFIQLKASNFLWFCPIIKSRFHIFPSNSVKCFQPPAGWRVGNIKLRKSVPPQLHLKERRSTLVNNLWVIGLHVTFWIIVRWVDFGIQFCVNVCSNERMLLVKRLRNV